MVFNRAVVEAAQEFIPASVWWIEADGIPAYGPYVDLNDDVMEENIAELVHLQYPDQEYDPSCGCIGGEDSGVMVRNYGTEIGRGVQLFEEANDLAQAVAMKASHLRQAERLDAYTERWTLPVQFDREGGR